MSAPPRPLTVGTAGHIDHGKTALVRALTGRDTDRLEEEKRRGISIELGFAELDLGGRRLSLVDVPGHERFVRTMIAGASGIDMYLLVVAADDGVMPQTREHVTVLRSLGVQAGVVAIAKCDAADPARRRRAAEQAAMLAPAAPLVEVSARTGAGLDDLRSALTSVARGLDEIGGSNAAPVLHVDRVFTVAGHGTVVTGTLWSGRIQRGERLRLLPSGREARVRSIEVHDRSLEAADAHQRVALNLTGVRRDEVTRGDVVTTDEAGLIASYRLDVELREGAEQVLRQRRVQVHLGTRETPARLARIGERSAQLRLERPLLARRGDRVVIRQIAPPDTLGGGIVVHASPPRHGRGWRAPAVLVEPEPKAPATVLAAPDRPSPLARRLLAALRDDGSRPRGIGALATFAGSGHREAERALAELVAAGETVRVQRDVVYPASEYRRLRAAILAEAEDTGSIDIAAVRDLLGLSRKYAQALLEHLNAERVLRRDGDRHLFVGRQGSGGPSGLQSQQGGEAHRLEGSIPSLPRQTSNRLDE